MILRIPTTRYRQAKTKKQTKRNFIFLSMKKTYTQPKLEVMDVAVELGFAQTNVESPGYGGEIQPALELD